MKKTLTAIACLVALLIVAHAEPIKKSESVTVKAKIEAIDHEARTIVLKGKDGRTETLYLGPEVKRFDELKVGDEVTFRYTESVVLKVQKPGDKTAPASSDQSVVQRGAGAKPSGSITAQETATVLIRSIDPTTPAMTVQTEDGRTVSFKVQDKSLLGAVKVGDRVEITYTVELQVSVA